LGSPSVARNALELLAVPVQGQDSTERETLQVGVRVAPPFVIPDGANGYDGLAIRLWETALIASSLTVGQLESRVSSPADLRRANVAALPGTTAAEWLSGRRIDFSAYETLTDALHDLERGEIDAVVSDEALLRYQISAFEMRRLHVLPFTLDEQDYGFAVIEAGALREPINRALLTVTVSEEWERWQREFLGD